jgi:hypothetical protein
MCQPANAPEPHHGVRPRAEKQLSSVLAKIDHSAVFGNQPADGIHDRFFPEVLFDLGNVEGRVFDLAEDGHLPRQHRLPELFRLAGEEEDAIDLRSFEVESRSQLLPASRVGQDVDLDGGPHERLRAGDLVQRSSRPPQHLLHRSVLGVISQEQGRYHDLDLLVHELQAIERLARKRVKPLRRQVDAPGMTKRDEVPDQQEVRAEQEADPHRESSFPTLHGAKAGRGPLGKLRRGHRATSDRNPGRRSWSQLDAISATFEPPARGRKEKGGTP